MPIEFTCPHCGATTRVADQYIGQSGPCRQCGQIITVTPAGAVPGYAPAQVRSGLSGWVIALIVLGGLAFLAVLGFLILIALLPILLPAVQSAREAACEALCENNLRQIGLAIRSYESVHNHLPLPVETDQNGRPMHSWRVRLLPYLEHNDLWDAYDMNEPWDGPRNSMLADMMPEVLRCPSDFGDSAAARTSETSYVMLVGPGTPFDAQKPPGLAGLGDPSETMLVVEVGSSGINWLEPRDITVDELKRRLEDEQMGLGLGLNHPRGVNVLFADGSVRTLSADELLMRLEALRAEAAVPNEWQ